MTTPAQDPFPPPPPSEKNSQGCAVVLGLPTAHMTTGEALLELAPDAFHLIRNRLGWSTAELAAWNYAEVRNVGFFPNQTWRCGQMPAHGNGNLPCIPDTAMDALKFGSGALRPRTLDLGCCYLRGDPPFPRLQATVPESPSAPFVNPNTAINPAALVAPTEAEVDPWDVLEAFLPEWFDAVTTLDVSTQIFNPFEADRVFQVKGTQVVAPDGDLPSAFWPDRMFERWVRAAVATVYGFIDEAFACEGAGPTKCNYQSESDLEDKLRGQTVEAVLGTTFLYNCSDLRYSLFVRDDGRFHVVNYNLGYPGGDPKNGGCLLDDKDAPEDCASPCVPAPPQGANPDGSHAEALLGPIIRYCRFALKEVVSADYLMWWAGRLLWWGDYCHSPWYLLVGLLAARAGLSDIVAMSATLLHELCHQKGYINHCGNRACAFDWWRYEFLNRMMARLGLPMPPHTDRHLTGYSIFDLQDLRFATGYPKCNNEDADGPFLARSDHCNLIDMNHHAELRTDVPGQCVRGGARLLRVERFNIGKNRCG